MRLSRQLVVIGFCGVAACHDPSGPGAGAKITALPRQLSPVEQDIIAANNTFGVRLLRAVNDRSKEKNVFLSPLSASMALGMTMNGTGSTTFDEMRATLGFGNAPLAQINEGYRGLIDLLAKLDPNVKFSLANAIWYARIYGPTIEAQFLSNVKQYFAAEVGPLDMGTPESVNAVNSWAKKNTNGKIEKVLDQISQDTYMLLANAIYFNGNWRQQFDKARTRPEPFNTLSRGARQVPTMERKGGFRHGSNATGTVVELPYGGDAWAMTILLPPEGVDINTFVAELDLARWNAALANLQDADYFLLLPKFKLEWEDTLNRPLQAMGMRSAFGVGPVPPDFTPMSRSMGRDLFISFVKQKTYVDVHEVGTEAAAVTVVGVGIVSMPPVVRINRPFVFAIRERLSGTILFLGKVVDL